eukprot:12498-Heterococcus_DN1.PRE.3
MVIEPASGPSGSSRLHGGGRAEPVKQFELAAATVFGRLPDVLRPASDGAKVPRWMLQSNLCQCHNCSWVACFIYNTFLGHLQPRRASTGAVTAVAPTPLLHVGARNKTGGCRQQFFTSKGIELCDLAYKEQEAHRKQAFASSDLDEVFNRYERKKQDAESAKYGARWQALFMFQQMHEADRPAGARPVRLVGSDNAVYERLYRAEPRKVRHCSLACHSSVYACALYSNRSMRVLHYRRQSLASSAAAVKQHTTVYNHAAAHRNVLRQNMQFWVTSRFNKCALHRCSRPLEQTAAAGTVCGADSIWQHLTTVATGGSTTAGETVGLSLAGSFSTVCMAKVTQLCHTETGVEHTKMQTDTRYCCSGLGFMHVMRMPRTLLNSADHALMSNTNNTTNNSSSSSSDALAVAAAADEAVEKKLHRLYTAFDTHRTDACEWRLVTAHPHETFDAALHFAFALLSSEGSFAADSSDPVPLPDILELITALMRRDAAAEATALLETVRAWLELGNEDPEARHQIEVAQTAGRDPVSAKLSLRLLKKLLQHKMVAPLLQVATRFGRRDKYFTSNGRSVRVACSALRLKTADYSMLATVNNDYSV